MTRRRIDAGFVVALDKMFLSGPPLADLALRLLGSVSRGDAFLGLSGRHAADRLADQALALAYVALIDADGTGDFDALLARRPRLLKAFSSLMLAMDARFESDVDAVPSPAWGAPRRFAWIAWRVRRESRQASERLPVDRRTLAALLERVSSDESPVSSDGFSTAVG